MSDSPSDNGRPDFFNYTDDALTGSIAHAIRQNNKNTLLQLLKKRKRNPLPLPADNRRWTALHVAASRPEYKDCLELLFEYRDSILIDINDQTFEGETPLYIACVNGCEDSVEILLQNGCDPYKKTLENDTALLAAVANGSLKIVESLLNYPENINQPDMQGLTPLHLAALYGYLEISNILLEKGADIRSKDLYHHLPLHLACQNNYFDVARLLLKSDLTTINYPNDAGITPLMFAVENCDMKVVRFLLENGAKTDTCDKKGRMALHFAAYRGNAELLQFVLQSTDASSIEQCVSNIPNVLKAEQTLFSLTCCAIYSENVECLEILISSKLSKNILKTPHVERDGCFCVIYSPLAYLFKTISEPNDELLNAYLQLLLKHKITMLDEFFKTFQIKWPQRELRFIHPFFYIIDFKRPIFKQHLYLNLLIANGVNIDYCLQCYHDNSQPFPTFTDYKHYYEPLDSAIFFKEVEILKLLISTSVILEPNIVSVQFNPIPNIFTYSRCMMFEKLEEYREIFQYLISLKPVYFTQFQLRGRDDQTDLPRYPYSTIQEEFSKSTLQQLCRTVIRQHLREYTLEDNLRNFKRKIMELPLPTSLKDYLLFKE